MNLSPTRQPVRSSLLTRLQHYCYEPLLVSGIGWSPETHSEEAYFPQRPISHYDSEPLGGLTDFCAFDCNAWVSEQGVVGSSTFPTNIVERTLVHRSTPSSRLVQPVSAFLTLGLLR